MRLAQEYEVEFGAIALHHKLRSMISDRDYVPMEAHKRLLRLPWADVLTTNWDTLLERTCDTVPERHMQSSERMPIFLGVPGLESSSCTGRYQTRL